MSTYDEVLFQSSLTPAARTDGAANGGAVDRMVNGGMQDAVLVVHAGTVTDGSHAITVQESADGSTGWADVDSANVQGALPTLTSADSDSAAEVGVRPEQRYVRAVATTTGSTTGGVFGVGFTLGRARFEPVSRA